MSETDRNPGKDQQEEKLEQAIQRLMAGESLDTVLARAGSDANWLEPLLILAAGVQDIGETVSVPPAETSLAQFLAEAERLAPSTPVAPTTPPWWKRLTHGLRFPSLGMPRLAGTAVSVAAIVLIVSGAFLLGSNSVAAAQNVLPGQPLYPIKRLGEEMHLWLPQSSESRDARMSEYEQRRRDEVHLLLGNHLEAPVTFRGVVETVGPSQIAVSGIFVDITQDTEIEEPLEVGASVLVAARTSRGGSLFAQSILVEQPAQLEIAPSATDTVQPTVTPTMMPSATATPTVTATPTATATSTPEPTATPQPATSQIEESTQPPAPTAVDTPEPEPEPTEETPEPPDEDQNENEDVEDGDENDNSDDDGNDNGNENENENGDEGNENEEEDDGDNSDDSNDSGDGDDDSDDNESGSESRGDSDGNENDNTTS
jgi:hypothetical protein